MVSEIKKILIKKTEETVNTSNMEIEKVYKDKEALVTEKNKLQYPDTVRTFNWFQKYITQRKVYKEYVQTGIENKARIPVLDENIKFCEDKIADLKQKVGNANRERIRIQSVSSLNDLGFNNFKEAVNFLKENNKDDVDIVLGDGVKMLTEFPSPNFSNISDICFINKTTTLPSSPEILSAFELEEKSKYEEIIGERIVTLTVKNWVKTVHGTLNCLDNDELSKYAYFIPFDKIDKSKLISALPSNTFFDSSIPLPEGSYIVVPESKLEECKTNFKDIQGITIIGYDDKGNETTKPLTINQALSILMNNLGYLEQEYTESGWENTKNQFNIQEILTKILEEECKINLNDFTNPSNEAHIETNRFLPYAYTKYAYENNKTKKYHRFAAALEYLHKNINDFNIKEKKLKTKTIIDFDTKLLKADPKDKSEERINDVFGDFIDILKRRDIQEIDKYLSFVDDKYIPDKDDFRDELLKATSRLKNDGPIRNKFFLNILERFKDLEIKQETSKEDQTAVKDEVSKESYINESGEIIRPSGPNKDISLDSGVPIFTPPENNEQEINKTTEEKDPEITIEPKKERDEPER